MNKPKYTSLLIIILFGSAFVLKEKPLFDSEGIKVVSADSLVYDTAPRWSKRTNKILFYSYRNDPQGADLYMVNPDRTGLERITNTYHNEWWSDLPFEGEIIYTSSDLDKSERFGGSEIYAIKPDGKFFRLTYDSDTTSFNIHPRVSPDGKQLLYCANCIGKGVNSEVYLINIDGTNVVNLTNNPSVDRYGSWSPDGKKVLFESNRSGNFELYVMDLKSMELEQLTFNQTDDIHGDWSLNNEIVFISNRDGDRELFIMNADGTNQVQLTYNGDKDVLPGWSPMGDKIAFSSYRFGKKDTGDIFIIDRDGTNEVRITMK